MTIDERIKTTRAEINSIEAKLRQLAQMQDQLIAEHNKNIGRLEAYEELLRKDAECETSEEKANDENADR